MNEDQMFNEYTQGQGSKTTEATDSKPHGTGKIAHALSKAQGEFERITKNKVNPYFNSNYADLDCIIEAVKGALCKYEIAHFFTMGVGTLSLNLVHSSGQSIVSTMELDQSKKPQDLGSTLTYYRRYMLAAIVNVAAEDDDDGNVAQSTHTGSNPQASAPPAQKASQPKSTYFQGKQDDNDDKPWMSDVELKSLRPAIKQEIMNGIPVKDVITRLRKKYKVSKKYAALIEGM
jgi:hypothetical protein